MLEFAENRTMPPLSGPLLTTPPAFDDTRGVFSEWFTASSIENALGYPFDLQQANFSTSHPGVIRGIHYADVPPGQAKVVLCPSGRIIDIVADLRVGSPTFGAITAVELSAQNRCSLYIPVGFGHGFISLEESALCYLTTSEYDPTVEHTINPYDPELGIEWSQWWEGDTILSDRDATAPSLVEALEATRQHAESQAPLPLWDECRDYEALLKDQWVSACTESSDLKENGR